MAAISDVIGRGWATGSMIGDDVARVRFSRGEQKIRQKYADQAEAEGKTLQDYMPQIEAEIRDLGTGMFGADRRGLRGEGGELYSSGALGRLSRDVLQQGERAAGAKALAGDQQGARQTRAQTLYGIGRFDDGQAQQIAGDTIGATRGAIGADGQYDPTMGAQRMGAVNAQYGDQAGAERNSQATTTFRLQAASALAGRLATAFQNPGTTTPDQIVGLYEGFKAKVPELGQTELRVGEDGAWNIYANGSKTATGSFNPNDTGDQTELMDMLSSFSRDPGTVVQQYQQARLQNISDQKKRDSETEGKFMDARIEAVATLTKDVGIPAEVVNKMFAGSSGSSGSTGWQLQEIGADASTYMIQKGGNVYVVKTNVKADPTKGELGGPVQVFEADGVTPVPASALNANERKEISSMAVSVAGELAKGNFQSKVQAVNATLNALGAMEAQYRGGKAPAAGVSRGGARSERNNNPGNIEDIGQFKGVDGYLGSDGRFAKFATPEAGQQAHNAQLLRYMQGKTTGKPLTTVQDIVGTWSPQSDPGNAAGSTRNYAAYVARRLGVDPGAQLSEADIPRLAQAMGEFESGNTSQGVIGAPAPRGRGAIDVASAAAPAPATAPTQRTRISEGYVRGAADDLRAMATDYERKRDALQRFEAENTSQPTATFTSNRETGMPQMGRRYSDPAQQLVGDRLRQEVAQAEAALRSATNELRENTGALGRQTSASQTNQRAAELARQYDPGMADFFGQLQ